MSIPHQPVLSRRTLLLLAAAAAGAGGGSLDSWAVLIGWLLIVGFYGLVLVSWWWQDRTKGRKE